MPDIFQEAPTAEEINRHYAACLDSVAAIVAAQTRVPPDNGAVQRNADHLKLMIAKDFWGPEHNMAPLQAAVDSAA
jgi:hypothetical protein